MVNVRGGSHTLISNKLLNKYFYTVRLMAKRNTHKILNGGRSVYTNIPSTTRYIFLAHSTQTEKFIIYSWCSRNHRLLADNVIGVFHLRSFIFQSYLILPSGLLQTPLGFSQLLYSPYMSTYVGFTFWSVYATAQEQSAFKSQCYVFCQSFSPSLCLSLAISVTVWVTVTLILCSTQQ